MALPLSELIYTNEEYLMMEREADERHEYIDGYIYKMAGESQEHGEISTNLSWIIGSQLRGTPCRARIKDTKVRSGPIPYSPQSRKGVFSYPDMLIVLGLESSLTIKSVNCTLHLSDVYDRMVFPPQNLELFSGTENEGVKTK